MSARLLLFAIAVPALATGCSSYGLATTNSPAVAPFSAVPD
jgi:hypothetical protein